MMQNNQYTTFNPNQNDQLKEPMFFGSPVNVSRYDQQKHVIFEKLIEKQLSFFWRPEEIDLSRDRVDYQKLSEAEKHIFLSNLKYQTLLDSIQGRSPNIAFLPLVSLPELETWIETWSFFETIHSRSYTHMVRSMLDDPSVVFDDIINDTEIRKRIGSITHYYDDLIFKTQQYQTLGEGIHEVDGKKIKVSIRDIKKALYLALQAVNALEAIRFYVSFACTFSFSERKKHEGSGKIMKLIARDEALHVSGTQHMINLMKNNKDGDEEMSDIALACDEEARFIFLEAVEQEKAWARHLFSKGSVLGLNETILCQYVDYIAYDRMERIGMKPVETKGIPDNPIPWINHYLTSDRVQVAPQETEISSYLVGQIDNRIQENDFEDIIL